jgi:hypothetical protein
MMALLESEAARVRARRNRQAVKSAKSRHHH